ncbi:response regulator [Methanosarcina sp. T3]|uniref:response regulator n=1 Tax=Methanosarcina sp. T3 TaxID=3439062 RepID=UPI003F84D8AD
MATEQIMGKSFEQLEKDYIARNMERAAAAMDARLETLKASVDDYAIWDDTYLFVQGQYGGYVDSNFGPEVVTNFDANIVLFYNSTNKLHYATVVEQGTTEHANVSTTVLDYIAANELLFSHPAPDSQISGIINSPEGPLLIASHPITKSSGEGPIAGTLIFAKFIDAELIKELAETTSLSLNAEALNQESSVPSDSVKSSTITADTSEDDSGLDINYVSESSVVGTTVLNDINGKPVLSLDVEMPRDVYQEGRSAIQYLLVSILVMGLVFELVLSFSLEKSVLSRISLLSTNLTDITKKGSLSSRINMEGKDEISELAGNINRMLKTLEEKEEVLKNLDIIESSLESMNAGIMIDCVNSRLIMNNKFIEMWNISADLLSQNSAAKVIEHVIAQSGDGSGGSAKIKELKSVSDKYQATLCLKNYEAVYDWDAGPLLQNGMMIGTVYCTTDITSVRLRELEEENKKRLETVLSSIISGVVLIDAETSTIVDANPIAEEMIGLPREKIIGKACHNFICPADKGKCPILDSRAKIDRSERVLINKDGNRVPILKSVVPISISDKKYLVESFVDLTKIKQAEDSLIQSKITAETANRAKSEFLATMSHELRTPLNSIIGFSDLMIAGNAGEISEKQKKFLGNISISGKHLLALINNILDISKIEAGKMELNYETFAVTETFNEVKQLISPLIEKKGLKVEFCMDEKLVNIYADKIRFKQILFNLASNAIKFTPEGGKIIISSKMYGETVQFTVRDTGIGIAEKDQYKLFKPFIQLDSATNRMYEGTGLGLSLVKSFVEMHKGKMWFESEVGKGTAFTFEIPLVAGLNKRIPEEVIKENAEAIKKDTELKDTEIKDTEIKDTELKDTEIKDTEIKDTEIKDTELKDTEIKDTEIKDTEIKDTESTPAQTIHIPQIIEPVNSNSDEPLILVVEDDDASRELLEVTLTQEGYRVASVSNGKEALELASKMKPFAITLDIMMPGMNGWDVLKYLKLEEQTRGIPVIITSMLDERDLGVVWGAVDHFIKPIQKDTLLSTLGKIKEKVAKSSLSVLVVDDEKSAVELVAEMLNGNEFNVLKAYGGKEAIDIAFKEQPEVIILDLMMPDISGFDVIKALKNRPETIDTPIIICTAKDLSPCEIKELDEHVSSIVHKGMFTREDLLMCIRQIRKVNLKDMRNIQKSESDNCNV